MHHERELAGLYAALGDYLAGGRADGIFGVNLGGPGSVPQLADLGAAQWHLDLLPSVPTPEQRAALEGLGYTLGTEQAEQLIYSRPNAPDVVLLSHELGASFDQKLLWTWLREEQQVEARAGYRRAYLTSGREAADAAYIPVAQTAHVARTDYGPPEEVAALLTPLGVPWMFAAGWALDLHRHSVLGAEPSRPHEDVDVIVGRGHQRAVGQRLAAEGYRVWGVNSGAYVPWTEPLQPPDFQMHAHRQGTPMLDIMLTDLSGDLWHYRRDPTVTMPLAQARLLSPSGLPYLAPEAVLLFKAGGANGVVRPKDQRDFRAVIPALDTRARSWLAARLPGDHPWLASLRA